MIRRAAPRLGLLLLLALGAGCSLAPQYTRPTVGPTESLAAWRDSVAVSSPDTSIANLSWWEMFPDSQLQNLVRIALAENQDLKIAIERIEEARARYGFSRADLYPHIDAVGTAGRIGMSEGSILHLPDGVGTDQDIYALGADLSWELDFFGRVRNASAAEKSLLLAADQGRRAVVLSLVTDVARSYAGLRDLDRRLEISRTTLGARMEYLELARTRFQGGVAPEGDLRQAESEYHRIESIVYDLERAVSQQQNAIAVLLGRMPAEVQRGAAVDQQTMPAQIPAGLPSTLLERRPDIREAEERLVSANARIGEAKALLFPRISLTGAFGWASTELDNFFTDVNQSWSILGNLVQPLFNAGKNRRRVEVTQSQQRQAAYSYQRTVVRAMQEVEDALVGYRKAGEQRTAQRARVQAERKVLELSEARYRGGVANYLEVLDAQRSLYTAEIDETQAIRTHVDALIQIYRALGGGWPGTPADEPIEESDEPTEGSEER